MSCSLAAFRLVLVALLLLPGAAYAGEVGDVSDVALTVYNSDLALIREWRPIQLDAGTQLVVLENVSGQLRPDTVHLDVADAPDLVLLEQDFDYDLVSSQKLLERFIGRTITLINDVDNSVIAGTLLSISDGLILESDGHILLDPPGRVVLPSTAAADLLLRPTLTWMLDSPQPVSSTAEVSYLSRGLSWNADYVLMLAADEKHVGIDGWVTLSNYSGTTYENASLKLVAGEVNQVPDYDEMAMTAVEPEVIEVAGMDMPFAEEDLFDYHLYDLQRKTTIRNNQQKQIGLLAAGNIPVEKIYEYNLHYGELRVMLEFENSEDNGLGVPMPEGEVRIFKQDSNGHTYFLREDSIDHTPRREKLRLFVGNPFDVLGESRQMDYKDLEQGYEETNRVELRNRKRGQSVEVKVRANLRGEWEILNANFEWERVDAHNVDFTVPVAADSIAVLNYTVRVTWK